MPEPASFDELYNKQFRRLTLQFYAYLGDLSEAQDVVQEAFCRAWARWNKIAGYEDPVAWVARVAWNLANSRWRRVKVASAFLRRQQPQSIHTAGPEPDRVHLVAALAGLPENQRRAVVMFYLADQPVSEIARQLEVPPGTVKTWLHRGRAALAAKLGADGSANFQGVSHE